MRALQGKERPSNPADLHSGGKKKNTRSVVGQVCEFSGIVKYIYNLYHFLRNFVLLLGGTVYVA